VKEETEEIKTFKVVLDDEEIMENFVQEPGQCAQFSVMGVGEATISITSPKTRDEFLEFSIAAVGKLTDVIHDLQAGDKVGIRGPYGSNFPYERMKGKDLLFIAGGIGLAPLRSLINFVFDNREDYGHIDIIYGGRAPEHLCFKDEIFEVWPEIEDTDVYLTVDDADEDEWDGRTGYVPDYLKDIDPDPEGKIAVTCGPPIMIKFVLEALEEIGFVDEEIITTLELNMKCGIGKCGRCNIGDKYVCLDGPVFDLSQIKDLPLDKEL
jgi:NAD(P)H-flavin reductase